MKSVLKSEISLGPLEKNMGQMLLFHKTHHGDLPAFAEKVRGEYQYWNWKTMVDDILRVIHYYDHLGLKPGARIGFITSNSYLRLVSEIGAMAMGLVSVPIFVGYPADLMRELILFSELHYLIVDDQEKIEKLFKTSHHPPILTLKNQNPSLEMILHETTFTSLDIQRIQQGQLEDLILIMYTSGTTNFPKGVCLTQKNIISQQKALEILWKLKPGLSFLCYLPWHHSFGGLFERFLVLYSGGCLAIDDSFGKDVGLLLSNFAKIKPHIFFSVPKIYQEIVNRVLGSKETENIFFHPELKFVFTAAAPLPLSVSDIFKKKGIPVIEGWGLTETSPCATLTSFNLDRTPGIVGFPIPGVEVALSNENELLVRGENVMKGYYKNLEATRQVLNEWFHTGDIGEVTQDGVKIISRKDRVFKLSNGEKVFPEGIEERIRSRCKFVKHAYVFGSGDQEPHVLIFPNHELFKMEQKSSLDEVSCGYPKNIKNYSQCLKGCLKEINDKSKVRYEKIGRALVIDQELSLEKNELTPSFKVIPRQIEKNYIKEIQGVLKNETPSTGTFLIEVDGEET